MTTHITFPPLVQGVIDGDAGQWSDACDYLHSYFTVDNNLPHAYYTVRGVDYDEDDNRVTPVDALAIKALDQGKLGKAGDDIMGDRDGNIGDLLFRIPNDVDLVDADEAMLADDSPLGELITVLSRDYDLSDKSVAALLARKRPRLVPLLLPAQKKALSTDGSLLQIMRELSTQLRADDGRLAFQLYHLNSAADIWDGLSQVQLLSVLLYKDYLVIRAAHKAEKKARKEEERRKKAEKKARKQEKEDKKRAKKLEKLERKRAAEKATKKEKEELEKLRKQAKKSSPITTDAFKLK